MTSAHDVYYEVVRAGPHDGTVASLYALRALVEEESGGSLRLLRYDTTVLYDDNDERFAVLAHPGWHNDGQTLTDSHGRVIAWIDSNRSARVRLAGAYYDTTSIITIPHSLLEDSHEANMQKLRDLVDEFLAAFDRCYAL